MPCLSFSELLEPNNQAEEQKVAGHLQSCPKCREKFENFKNLQTFLQKNQSHKFEKATEHCYDKFQLVSFIEKKQKLKSSKDYYIHLSRCDSCLNRHVALENLLYELKKRKIDSSRERLPG